MSKTQEKRERVKAEQQEFIKQRRLQELKVLEAQFELGLKLYEENKDKLSAEEIEQMEAEKQKFMDTLFQFKKEHGLAEKPQE
jgi:hypothetical protein